MSDYITIVRAGAPINKHFTLSKGKVVKQPAKQVSRAAAMSMRVPDALALQHILEQVNRDPEAYIVLGFIPGTEPRGDVSEGEPYVIWSAKEVKAETGKEQAACEIDGVKVYTRSKANFAPSTWFLFDYDVVPGMPEELMFDDPNDWLAAMHEMCPGLERMLITRSNSSRILIDGKRANESRNIHCYVQATDAEDIARFSSSLLVSADKYVFQKPSFSRDTGEVLATQPWSIFDPTTFSPERQVYCGAPTVRGKGLSVAEPELTVFNGRRLDTRVIETPSKEVNIRFKQQTGMTLQIGGHWGFNSDTLRLDHIIETKKGDMSIEEYWLSEHGKLRCQVPFRDSTSFAGVLNRSKSSGRPCLFDVGSRTTYWPQDKDKPTVEQWLDVAKGTDDLPGRIEVIMQGIDLHNLSDMKVKALARKIVEGTDFTMTDVMDSRTPGADLGDTPSLEAMLGEYNRNMGVALYGGKALVFTEKFDHTLQCFATTSIRDTELKKLKQNERAATMTKNGPIDVPPFPIWMNDTSRNTYSDVVFEPKPGIYRDGPRPMPKGGVYNMYQGLGIKPKKGNCKMFRQYLLDVFAAGDRTKYEYIMDWFAAVVQYPHKIGLPVLIFKSGEGTGKGALSDNFLRPCFDPHFAFADSQEAVSGRFNWQQATNILTVMNEATWGGDVQHMAAYKTLFWDTHRQLEKKYSERVMMPNYCHGIVFTNEDWSVPVGMGDRRHVGFDLSPIHRNDTVFYAALEKHMKQDGGQQAFLYDLLQRQISHADMRTPPGYHSEAKQTSFGKSMKPLESWLYDWLMDGDVELDTGDDRPVRPTDTEATDNSWSTELQYTRNDLYDAYYYYCKQHNKRPSDKSHFGRELRTKFYSVPGERAGIFRDGPAKGHIRTRLIADLSEARQLFEKIAGFSLDWHEN